MFCFSINLVSPAFRNIFSDPFGQIINCQWHGECADIEMKAVECMEAYGMDRGLQKCTDLLADFRECLNRDKQIRRLETMRNERNRQYWDGERSKQNRYAEPPLKATL